MLNNTEFNIQYYLNSLRKKNQIFKKILNEHDMRMKIKKYALFSLKLTQYVFLIFKLNFVNNLSEQLIYIIFLFVFFIFN